jgi:cysteinyl-tRNA synthetase
VEFAKLSSQKLAPKLDDECAASEANEFSFEKKNPRDFALWKCNIQDEEVGWENPYSGLKGNSLRPYVFFFFFPSFFLVFTR